MTRAVFLDRDGVLIHDRGYISRPEDVEILPGVPEALLALKAKGWKLVVVTNQSGIGRGLFTEDDYFEVTRRMLDLLADAGVHIDALQHCPHAPDAGCECRKPKPGMLLRAAAALGLDLAQCVMIGDRATDIKAGKAAGCRRSFWVYPGYLRTAVRDVLKMKDIERA